MTDHILVTVLDPSAIPWGLIGDERKPIVWVQQANVPHKIPKEKLTQSHIKTLNTEVAAGRLTFEGNLEETEIDSSAVKKIQDNKLVEERKKKLYPQVFDVEKEQKLSDEDSQLIEVLISLKVKDFKEELQQMQNLEKKKDLKFYQELKLAEERSETPRKTIISLLQEIIVDFVSKMDVGDHLESSLTKENNFKSITSDIYESIIISESDDITEDEEDQEELVESEVLE